MMSLEEQYPGGTTHLVTGPGVVMLQLIVNVAFGQVSGVTEIQSGTLMHVQFNSSPLYICCHTKV